MSTARGTWKAAERRIADYFGTTRTPLSGGNGKQTRSDTLHKGIFVEAKLRVTHAVVSLWRETKVLADKEKKIPVICLNEKGKEGFWIMCHSSDFVLVADMVKEVGYICNECAKRRKGVWPEGHVATVHPGACPDCGEYVGLASVGDYDWPQGSDKPLVDAGRD
jgi:hypothetical protein